LDVIFSEYQFLRIVSFLISVLVVLGCFFGLGLEVFAGCVHRSTQKHTEAQKSVKKHKKARGSRRKCKKVQGSTLG
jgi:hypothetical protein